MVNSIIGLLLLFYRVMALTYPSVLPDFASEFILPDYGIEIFKNSGAESRSNPTNIALNSKLTFSYQNRSASEFLSIVSFYHITKGQLKSFFLPQGLWRHGTNYTSSLKSLLENVSWRFADKLRISTVKSDFYTFDVNFTSVARLEEPEAGLFPCNII